MNESFLGIANNACISEVGRTSYAFEVGFGAFVIERVYSQDVSAKEEQICFIRNTSTFRFLGLIGENPETFVMGLDEKAIKGIVAFL
jgi:hypothetical protein